MKRFDFHLTTRIYILVDNKQTKTNKLRGP
jgi:hypothetical protein